MLFSFSLGLARLATIKIDDFSFLKKKKKKTPYLLISKVGWLQRENEYHSQITGDLLLMLSKGECRWIPIC